MGARGKGKKVHAKRPAVHYRKREVEKKEERKINRETWKQKVKKYR